MNVNDIAVVYLEFLRYFLHSMCAVSSPVTVQYLYRVILEESVECF